MAGKKSRETSIIGLRQRCSIVPTLFKIYLSKTPKNWKRKCRGMGTAIGFGKFYKLHFADDQAIFAEDQQGRLYAQKVE